MKVLVIDVGGSHIKVLATGKARTGERDRHELPRGEPGRPRDHGRRLRARDVDPADLKAIGIRVRLDGEQASDPDARVELADCADSLHREPRHGETLGEIGRRSAPRDELGQPGQRNTHG